MDWLLAASGLVNIKDVYFTLVKGNTIKLPEAIETALGVVLSDPNAGPSLRLNSSVRG